MDYYIHKGYLMIGYHLSICMCLFISSFLFYLFIYFYVGMAKTLTVGPGVFDQSLGRAVDLQSEDHRLDCVSVLGCTKPPLVSECVYAWVTVKHF